MRKIFFTFSLRNPLLYALASIFLIWHLLAIFIGPAPGSYTMGKIYPKFVPYLNSFNLNNEWGFFAPDPHSGSLARYIVEDKQGKQFVFKLNEAEHRNDPAFLRRSSFYLTMIRKRQPYLTAGLEHLCQRHAEMKPAGVQLFVGHQIIVSHDDYLKGGRPLQDNFINLEYFEALKCPAV
jgi:hypothetical protein